MLSLRLREYDRSDGHMAFGSPSDTERSFVFMREDFYELRQ
jgi:hypothetical protein